MPYRTMSIEDFAKHIGMDAREVRRLAERGKLPTEKVGGQYRFNRARVTEWLQAEMPTLDEARLVTLERTMGADPDGQYDHSNEVVTSLIGLAGIDLALPANTSNSVLRKLVNLAERTELLWDPDGLYEAIVAREGMGSTALPNGVAIPHPRQPMPYVSAEPMICVARTTRGIGFGAATGGLTNLFFLICSHDDRAHLHVLARLMRILTRDTVAAMRDVETSEDMLELLMAAEIQAVDKMQRHD